MIRARVLRTETGRFREFTITGHAQYAEHGYDIVCAAVSVLSQNAVNSVEILTGKRLSVLSGDGWLHCRLDDEAQEDARVDLLLQSMLAGIQAVQQQYSEFVSVLDVKI